MLTTCKRYANIAMPLKLVGIFLIKVIVQKNEALSIMIIDCKMNKIKNKM